MPAGKKRPSKQDKELAALKEQNATLMQMLQGSAARPHVNVGTMMVGIKNVSSNTVGIAGSPTPHERDVQVAAGNKAAGEPAGTAVVSYPWWRVIRDKKDGFVAKGLIIRDDSVLGPLDIAAPADQPNEIPASAAINIVLDPDEWIVSRSDAQIREDILKMTSEPSLRRLQSAVDLKVEEFREKFGCDGTKSDENIAREREAAMALPANYGLVERLVEDRLYTLSPSSRLVSKD